MQASEASLIHFKNIKRAKRAHNKKDGYSYIHSYQAVYRIYLSEAEREPVYENARNSHKMCGPTIRSDRFFLF